MATMENRVPILIACLGIIFFIGIAEMAFNTGQATIDVEIPGGFIIVPTDTGLTKSEIYNMTQTPEGRRSLITDYGGDVKSTEDYYGVDFANLIFGIFIVSVPGMPTILMGMLTLINGILIGISLYTIGTIILDILPFFGS